MIDIKFLRENPEVVRASQTGRGEDATIVDKAQRAMKFDAFAINEFEVLRAEQNTLSKLVGTAK